MKDDLTKALTLSFSAAMTSLMSFISVDIRRQAGLHAAVEHQHFPRVRGCGPCDRLRPRRDFAFERTEQRGPRHLPETEQGREARGMWNYRTQRLARNCCGRSAADLL